MFKKSIAALCIMVITLSSCGKIEPISDIDGSGNYIIPEKQLKLSVWSLSDYEDTKTSGTDVVAKWLNEQTNVTISKIYDNDNKVWTDRLAQLVMDGQLPNIVNAEGGEGMIQFLKLDKIKKTYKLTEDEIKQYAPNVWKKTPQKYWEYLKNPNGDIIGIPYDLPTNEQNTASIGSPIEAEYIKKHSEYENDIYPQNSRCLWIRDDILKNLYPESKSWEEITSITGDFLGEQLLDIPISTTEEFIHFMYDIGNGDYRSQSGKKVLAFGYSEKNGLSDINMLGADMYGYKNYNFFTSWKDDKINLMLDDEIVYNTFKTQNQMIADDIIDGDSIYDTEKEYLSKVIDGRYAIISPDINGTEINRLIEESGAEFRYRPFLTNITSEYVPYKTEHIFGGAICILNNLNPTQVHQVLNWLNVCFSDEFDSVNNWGTPDMYTENDSGKRLFKDDNLNRYFILGEKNAITDASELFGLSGGGNPINIVSSKLCKYTPSVMYQSTSHALDTPCKFTFAFSDAHVSSLQTKPVSNISSCIYSSIPEVTDFLYSKSEIETEAKRLLLKTPDEFSLKWQEFIDDVYKITDIAAMEEKMTAAAKK